MQARWASPKASYSVATPHLGICDTRVLPSMTLKSFSLNCDSSQALSAPSRGSMVPIFVPFLLCFGLSLCCFALQGMTSPLSELNQS